MCGIFGGDATKFEKMKILVSSVYAITIIHASFRPVRRDRNPDET
jgi:hypothetical protein